MDNKPNWIIEKEIAGKRLRKKQDTVIKYLEIKGYSDKDSIGYEQNRQPITLNDLKTYIYPELEKEFDRMEGLNV